MFEECLYFNCNALARSVNKIWAEAYRPFDLSPPHAFLLRVVLAKPGLMPSELAEELKLSRSTVTRFMERLEVRGLINRDTVSKDGREVQVFATQAAKDIHSDLDKIGKNLSQQMFASLGQEDVTEMVMKLREFQKAISK